MTSPDNHDDVFWPFVRAREIRRLWNTPAGQWYQSHDRLAVDLLILKGNADDAMRTIQVANQDESIRSFHDGTPELEWLTIDLYRHFMNFLTAASALADHQRVHQNHFSPELKAVYDEQVQDRFVSTPAFHLVVKLRNEGQHHVLPLSVPVLTGRHSSSDGIEQRLSWYIPKEWLLEVDSHWDTIVMEFLSRDSLPRPDGTRDLLGDTYGANDVDVAWLISAYLSHAMDFSNWFLSADLDLHQEELAEFADRLVDLDR